MNPDPNIIKEFYLPQPYDSDGNKYFEFGSYSFVFFRNGVATKIFRKNNGIPEKHVKKVFLSEVEAYNLASSSQDLVKIVPKFFGTVQFEEIINKYDLYIDPSNFLLNCAYQMEHIKARFYKLGNYDIRDEVSKRFANAGIHYLTDASIAILKPHDKNSINFRVIDFAVQEHRL